MTQTLVRWVGARNPAITDTILTNGAATDLSSDTVKFKAREVGDPDAALVVDAAAGFVTDGTDGQVRYAPAAALVASPRLLVCWWEITSGSLTQDTGEFILDVREHDVIGASLCELADVRIAMELNHGEDKRLSKASELIPVASDKIQAWTQREFTPTDSTARTFRVRGTRVNLAPYDLRTATTVKLHPEASSPQTLTANEDYWLGPIPARDGVYNEVRVWGGLDLTSTLWERTGIAQLEITGDWGFASVPDTVTRACALTVAAWMDKAISEYGEFVDGEVNEIQPAVRASLALPRDVKMLLSEFKREGVPA